MRNRLTERLWNRDFILSTIAGFFSAMVLYSAMTTMAVFSAETLGASESMAGLAASIVMIGGVFGPPLGIFLADRFSYNALWGADFGFALAALAIFAVVRIRKP
ncbi:MAG: hypothetical protein FWF33_07995, partial [Clostridiales bacterium]|nr:hypothetical protein [Clostridiales bacterium]